MSDPFIKRCRVCGNPFDSEAGDLSDCCDEHWQVSDYDQAKPGDPLDIAIERLAREAREDG